MQYASRGVKMLERSFLDTIDVYYPDSDGGLSYFSRSATIHIDADDAWYWDAMQHEYGHYVQYSLGIGITDLGLKHDDGENLAETHGKETATQLAWTEGWATYFALTLQDKLEIDKLRIPLVCDGVWTSSNGGTAIEHNHQRQGEFGEGAVAAVLYDLTDSANNGESTIDSLALDVRAVWDITVDNSCKTFSEFINAINGVYPNSTKLNMGNLLSFYKMAAVISDDSVSIGSTMATITWDDNSYSSTAKYPNNSFCVAFYDSNYELILKTSYTTEESQIITAAQCNAIINATGNTVYWCIETKQTDSPVTGPYNSNLGTINIP